MIGREVGQAVWLIKVQVEFIDKVCNIFQLYPAHYPCQHNYYNSSHQLAQRHDVVGSVAWVRPSSQHLATTPAYPPGYHEELQLFLAFRSISEMFRSLHLHFNITLESFTLSYYNYKRTTVTRPSHSKMTQINDFESQIADILNIATQLIYSDRTLLISSGGC